MIIRNNSIVDANTRAKAILFHRYNLYDFIELIEDGKKSYLYIGG